MFLNPTSSAPQRPSMKLLLDKDLSQRIVPLILYSVVLAMLLLSSGVGLLSWAQADESSAESPVWQQALQQQRVFLGVQYGLQQHPLSDRGDNTGEPVYRLIPLTSSTQRHCLLQAQAAACGEADIVLQQQQCQQTLPKFAAWRCAWNDHACWLIQPTGEACYQNPMECAAPKANTCNFYSNCLERYQACGEQGYALNYGQKYCYQFQALSTLTDTGRIWRDRTLPKFAVKPPPLGAMLYPQCAT